MSEALQCGRQKAQEAKKDVLGRQRYEVAEDVYSQTQGKEVAEKARRQTSLKCHTTNSARCLGHLQKTDHRDPACDLDARGNTLAVPQSAE
jgi:hypothetical protein